MDSIYDFSANDNRGLSVAFNQFKGKVLLIVNTASKCGFTPQYKALETLYETYKDRGFIVLGFPCNQFANQEPDSDEQIAQFCEINFGVTFPLMQKIEVNGPNALPLFTFLKRKTPSILGSAIKWNFTKFLISADGQRIKRYSPMKDPLTLEDDIAEMLSHRGPLA